MGLLDMGGAQQPQMGGLLGAFSGGAKPAPDSAQGVQIPPEVMQVIEHLRGADQQQRQEYTQKVMQSIQSSGKDQATQQQMAQQFMQAMGQ
jgi:hypothetical protein